MGLAGVLSRGTLKIRNNTHIAHNTYCIVSTQIPAVKGSSSDIKGKFIRTDILAS